jgi:hypothetical protein
LSLEQKMLERAISAADDAHIFVVADFLPNDLEVTQFTDLKGQVSSNDASADVEAWGGSHGGVDRLPLTLMAVSPTSLYLLVTEPGQGILTADSYELVETIDRENLRVRSVERDDLHELIIEDDAALRTFTMKSGHAGSHFMKDVLEILDAGPSE